MLINVRKYRRSNKTNVQPRETGNLRSTRRGKTIQKHNTICVEHHYAQLSINNVIKTCKELEVKTKRSLFSCGTGS